MAAQRMRGQLRHDVAAILLQHSSTRRHVIDRVVAHVRLRAVRGHAARRASPACGAFMSDDDIELRRLGHNRRIRHARQQFRPPGRRRQLRAVATVGGFARISRRPVRRAGEAVLFIDRADQHDRRPAGWLLFGQPGDRRNHRRHAAFDVARAAAIQPASVDLRLERLDRHSLDGHRVLMGLQHHDLAAALRRTSPSTRVTMLSRSGATVCRSTGNPKPRNSASKCPVTRCS